MSSPFPDDPFRWLEEAHSSAVTRWVHAQQERTDSYFATLPKRQAIAARYAELYACHTPQLPVHAIKSPDARVFTSKLHYATRAQELHLSSPRDSSLLLTSIPAASWWSPDPTGRWIAYNLREGTDRESLMLFSVEHRTITEVLHFRVAPQPVWLPTGAGFYYIFLPSDVQGHVDAVSDIRYHELGTSSTADLLIAGATHDPHAWTHPLLSDDGHWLFLARFYGWDRSELYFRPEADRHAPFQALFKETNAWVTVTGTADRFIIHTNWKAPNWRVLTADPLRPGPEHWRPLIPERDDTVISSVTSSGDHLLVRVMSKAYPRLEVYTKDGELLFSPLESNCVSDIALAEDPNTPLVRTETFIHPISTYRLNITTRTHELLGQAQIPFDSSPFLFEQVSYPSKDGTLVSMFIIRRKDQRMDGSARCVIHGYGGFGASITPSWNRLIVPWLEHGIIVAMPNIAGGAEYGTLWHQRGKGRNKQATFDDMIAAAEYLLKERYTLPSRLALWGSSNGGLTVGAAMTQRPDLFRAVLCGVPLLDMIRYNADDNHNNWMLELGDPRVDADRAILRSYSPYHQIRADVVYPAVYMFTEPHSTEAFHAQKMVAALQALPHESRKGPVIYRYCERSGRQTNIVKGTEFLLFLLTELLAD